MVVKLVIAGIKWRVELPEHILNNSISSFETNFDGEEDISVNIVYSDIFEEANGTSITSDILEWYIKEDVDNRYHLLKRDDQGSTFISLVTNSNWSKVSIKLKDKTADALHILNIMMLEIVFRNRIIYHKGIIIHSSAIEYNDEAVIFSAPSGTGKTTHVRLWNELYNIKVINDDHPAIRMIDGKAIIFGTPWAGETKRFTNTSTLLKNIVILEQGKHNEINQLGDQQILKELVPRCFLPYFNNETLSIALSTFSEMMTQVNVYKLACRPDNEAVELVHDTFYV